MAILNFRNATLVLIGLAVSQHIIFGMTVEVLTDRLDEIRALAEMQNGWVYFNVE